MEAYCNTVRRLEDKFDGLELNHVPRKYNEDADELAKIASGRTTVPPNIFAHDISKPTVEFKQPTEAGPSSAGPSDGNPPADGVGPMDTNFGTTSADEAEAMEVDEAPASRDWRVQYLEWMVRGLLPSDRAQARRLARRAKSFVLIDNGLYKRSPSGVLQRCIPIPEGKELIRDIHAGVCGHHAAPRTLVGNVFRQGFYWPTAVADATDVVRTCEGCQFYARKTHLPAHALQTIPVTWPFAVWGLDLFTGKKFLAFCDSFHIRVDWSAVAHPQTNGQVERANGMILQGLKPRIFNKLNKFGRRWLTELPSVIWSLRTTALVLGPRGLEDEGLLGCLTGRALLRAPASFSFCGRAGSAVRVALTGFNSNSRLGGTTGTARACLLSVGRRSGRPGTTLAGVALTGVTLLLPGSLSRLSPSGHGLP
ncbi:uncharacterized protein LOC120675105 [Panicum virgatum]|uniref:uncharacterized protein LOC120675105 n=1 Tax=Panicum virgatum TaxID=38727 RepID=UPI0019D5D306|nr:uncharacterized protein LOC120675105 [Panicum virgatum]